MPNKPDVTGKSKIFSQNHHQPGKLTLIFHRDELEDSGQTQQTGWITIRQLLDSGVTL